jgi:predicted oxidoreductase
MQTLSLGTSPLRASRLAYGCWRVAGSRKAGEVTPADRAAGRRAILTAWEAGYTLFDNADIYGGGEAERILGEALKEAPELRRGAVIATKGGIRTGFDPRPGSPGRYDFSAQHIIRACEGSLERLGIETIDLYLLHRPDYLADPQEVAQAFAKLEAAGKVRYFGVSNFRPSLVTAAKAACPMPLITHQVEISLAKLDAFTDGTLDQCLVEKLTPMAWSPLAGGLLGNGAVSLLPSQQVYRPDPFLPAIDAVARERGSSRVCVALAWLLKHPSRIQPIIGSVRPERIREAAQAAELELTREEWYRLLIAALGAPLP